MVCSMVWYRTITMVFYHGKKYGIRPLPSRALQPTYVPMYTVTFRFHNLARHPSGLQRPFSSPPPCSGSSASICIGFAIYVHGRLQPRTEQGGGWSVLAACGLSPAGPPGSTVAAMPSMAWPLSVPTAFQSRQVDGTPGDSPLLDVCVLASREERIRVGKG